MYLMFTFVKLYGCTMNLAESCRYFQLCLLKLIFWPLSTILTFNFIYWRRVNNLDRWKIHLSFQDKVYKNGIQSIIIKLVNMSRDDNNFMLNCTATNEVGMSNATIQLTVHCKLYNTRPTLTNSTYTCSIYRWEGHLVWVLTHCHCHSWCMVRTFWVKGHLYLTNRVVLEGPKWLWEPQDPLSDISRCGYFGFLKIWLQIGRMAGV